MLRESQIPKSLLNAYRMQQGRDVSLLLPDVAAGILVIGELFKKLRENEL